MMNPRTTPRPLLLKVLLVYSFLVASVSSSFCLGSDPPAEIDQGLPNEYGSVIYQNNEDALNQIFIIGQSHRSAVDGKNGQDTVLAQMEIFRIYEWLIRRKKVEILLPEGFFQRGIVKNDARGRPFAKDIAVPLDNERLKRLLEDTSRFVSADTLLASLYPISLGQVEDEDLYRKLSHLIRKLGNRNDDINHALIEELNDHQKKRTARMLENIPLAVENAFQRGDSENKHAIFTIGMVHITDILEFFHGKTGSSSGNGEQLSSSAFDLLEQGYGITVILPKSLAENDKVLRLSRLEQLVSP